MPEEFFTPVDIAATRLFQSNSPRTLGGNMRIFVDDFPSLEELDIAIIGVKEGRETNENEGTTDGPDHIRRYLYELKRHNKLRVADLGNIEAGEQFSYTEDYLARVMDVLLERNIIPIVLGGSKQLAYGMYTAYGNRRPGLEITTIDARIELGEGSYLNRIMLHEPNYLFNLSALGYQSYFVEPEYLDAIERMYFDHVRLGSLRGNLEEAEPVLRNTDMLVFDIGAVKQADAPGNAQASPNGLLGDEACQLARYAGVSNRLSSFGLFEINPAFDTHHAQTARLAAQMVWYFIDGFYSRRHDEPAETSTDFIKYRINLKNSDHELVFHKSRLTDRWWMELPYNRKKEEEKTFFIPCSYKDYLTAIGDEMPDRWWRTFQKLV